MPIDIKMKQKNKNHCLQKLVFLNVLACLCISFNVFADGGKILATSGLTQVEGAGGGGLVPWATLAGYDTRDQTSLSLFNTQVNLEDYRLHAWGVSTGLYDRFEFSAAQQTFDLSSGTGDIRQNILGAKVRLYGDVVYTDWPQVSFGIQHKRLLDNEIADAVGADNSHQGTDLYLAMTKVHLGLVAGYNFVWNLALRATKANEMGLLGFGGSENSSYELMPELSLGLLLNQHLAVGYEYRQKPDNLELKESDWQDFFVSYLPSKQVSITLARADLNKIAGVNGQTGWYVSLTASL